MKTKIPLCFAVTPLVALAVIWAASEISATGEALVFPLSIFFIISFYALTFTFSFLGLEGLISYQKTSGVVYSPAPTAAGVAATLIFMMLVMYSLGKYVEYFVLKRKQH